MIVVLRGQRVLMDSALAQLYGVSTKRLNEQVKRNANRFPADFMFRVSAEDLTSLRSQNATSKKGRGGSRYIPHAFTEHGTIMAAMVLNSTRAIEMSVFVVRAFVQLRESMLAGKEINERLTQLERKLASHDQAIVGILEAIRRLANPLSDQMAGQNRPIGFVELEEKKG